MFQPEYELTSFSLENLLAKIRNEKFPHITGKIDVSFSKTETLGFICQYPDRSPIIRLSAVLNHKDTPIEVIEHILIHELIHLEVPSGDKAKGEKLHTQAFWDLESELSPNAGLAMSWVLLSFSDVTKRDKKNERIKVLQRGYKKFRDSDLISLDKVRELCRIDPLPDVQSFC